MADKRFVEALKRNSKRSTDKNTTFYHFGGWKQSERKREFVEAGKQVARNEEFHSTTRMLYPLVRGTYAIPGVNYRHLC